MVNASGQGVVGGSTKGPKFKEKFHNMMNYTIDPQLQTLETEYERVMKKMKIYQQKL